MTEFIATIASTSGEWEVQLLALPPGYALGIIRHLKSNYWKYFDRERRKTKLVVTVNEEVGNRLGGGRRFQDGSVYFSIPIMLIVEHERELHLDFPRPESNARRFSPPLELVCEEKTYRRHEGEVSWNVYVSDFKASLTYLDDDRAKGEISGTGYSEPRGFNVKRAATFFSVPVRLSEEEHYVWQSIQIHVQFKLPEHLHKIVHTSRNWRAREVHRLRLEEIAAGISRKKR